MNPALSELGAGLRAARSLAYTLPPGAGRFHRFVYGLSLPFVLVGRALRDPALRGAYLKATLPLVVLVLGVSTFLLVKRIEKLMHADESSTAEPAKVEAAAAKAAAKVAEGIAKKVDPDHQHDDGDFNFDFDVGDQDPKATSFYRWTKGLSKTYGVIVLIETILVGFARFLWHPVTLKLGRSIGTSHPPDPLGSWARFRRRVWRRLRAATTLVWMNVPLALVAWLPFASKVGSLAVAYYWLSVYTLGTNGTAWYGRSEVPFFLRPRERLARIPMVKWVSRPYFRVLEWLTFSVRAPCAHFAARPSESLGLGLGRFICFFPILNSLTRLTLPVGAELLMQGEASSAAATPPG